MRRPVKRVEALSIYTGAEEKPTTVSKTRMKRGSDIGAEGPYEVQHLNLESEKIEGVQPFCTCVRGRGLPYTFDPNMGIYLHSAPQCWKPSRAYYEAAKAAGIITVKE